MKGSESSVSVCERRPKAGPSCSRSAALSARVRTLLWCEAATWLGLGFGFGFGFGLDQG